MTDGDGCLCALCARLLGVAVSPSDVVASRPTGRPLTLALIDRYAAGRLVTLPASYFAALEASPRMLLGWGGLQRRQQFAAGQLRGVVFLFRVEPPPATNGKPCRWAMPLGRAELR